MEIIKGKFSEAIVFSKTAEPYALVQVKNICDNRVSQGSKIRVMPDVHPGMVCPIGLTMTVTDRILPYLVGIDIGCGMTTAKILKHRGMEFKKLDSVIRDGVPGGFCLRKNAHRFSNDFDFSKLECAAHVYKDKAVKSLCTLGGGNHFIEIDRDDDDFYYITVHSGSRHLGKEVADFYLNEGHKIIQARGEDVPYELTYLEGDLMASYLNDVVMAQEFASLNRLAIIDEVAKGMKWKIDEPRSCIHNYVDMRPDLPVPPDTAMQPDCGKPEYRAKPSDGKIRPDKNPLLRKGAVSARLGEPVIIPVNMRDGIIIGEGKGNADWNYSAPHGSGRIMKREDVKNKFTVSAFKSAMKGIYSSCISKGTLDEAPFAYRGIEEILEAIEPTVSVKKIIKPVYNFKAEDLSE